MSLLKKGYFISVAMVSLVFAFTASSFSDIFSKDMRNYSKITEKCDKCHVNPPCDPDDWCYEDKI